ncbi:hypothetical protein EGH24_05475 [Halonotius terrestris]|uniref:Uncharacterized protein n=1 Tax=Halonotius terrestris TaxID=2487750 RepID=A0A8J8PCU9_9EURY|nr:hypothetical protein [Halonotius terrestris]TQQ82888.1 hypothetical protein EGH24_05475 [Halonotius terrestris]
MSVGVDDEVLGTGSIGAVDIPSCKPPIEVLTGNGECLVREYQPGAAASETAADSLISTYRDQRKAEQAVTKQLSNSRYPCALYWETDTSVGNIHWNDLFTHLRVEYSPFLQSWTVVPKADHFMYCSVYDFKQACRLAKKIQKEYNFKHLELCSRAGAVEKVIDHRFLRQSITESGVQFNP